VSNNTGGGKLISFKSFIKAITYASMITNATNTKWTHTQPHYSIQRSLETKSRLYQVNQALYKHIE